MQPAELRTARLVLRPLRATDIDALYEIQGNGAHMRHTFAAESREASAEWLERYERSRAVRGFAPWTVVRGTDERVIGWGGLGIDPLASKWGVEVSYSCIRRWRAAVMRPSSFVQP
jgi:RimJ/RimL family protein N-acetyltransferase